MELSIKMNEAQYRDVQGLLRRMVLKFSPQDMKRKMYRIGTVIQADIDENFDKEITFDGNASPALKPATIKWKADNNKTKKLKRFGFLQKLKIEATPKSVSVYTEAPYGRALNEREKYGLPFHFMGYGKKLLKKIDEVLRRILDEIK